MPKVPPGYVRIEHRLAMTNQLIAGMPQEAINRLIAGAYGQMLEDAVNTGRVDITYPIFIDGLQLQNGQQFQYDLQEIKVRLDYKERPLDRAQIDGGPRRLHA